MLENEYGCDDLAIGVPCVLGKDGMEKVLSLALNEQEQTNFDQSVAAVRKDIEALMKL